MRRDLHACPTACPSTVLLPALPAAALHPPAGLLGQKAEDAKQDLILQACEAVRGGCLLGGVAADAQAAQRGGKRHVGAARRCRFVTPPVWLPAAVGASGRRKRRTLEVTTGVHKSRVRPRVHTSCWHSLQELCSVGKLAAAAGGWRRGGGARPGNHARPGRSMRANPPAYLYYRGGAAPPAACRALSEGGSCVCSSKLARRAFTAS